MEQFFHVLKSVAERCGLAPIQRLALEPGVKSVIRVTIYHGSDTIADSVGTMVERVGQVDYGVVFAGRFNHRPLRYDRSLADYQAILQALRQLGFDLMIDQMNVAGPGADVCLVERAAGTFENGVLFALDTQIEPYSRLNNIVKRAFPEVLRAL